MPALDEKQNITLRLSKQTIQKARVLAAKRSTSISGLLAGQIEQLAATEDDYEKDMQVALALMEEGLDLGAIPKFDREALHER
jgi:hypothetical protein